jgi:uncharacterized membrane protein YkvA (DUF1232 family)
MSDEIEVKQVPGDEEPDEGFEEKEHGDFYRDLRRRMREWLRKGGSEHKWAEYLMFTPDLFYTLVKLIADPDVPGAKKAKLAIAVAYFISPIDLVPEGVVGPIGYIDDIILAAYVLDDIINDVDAAVVERNWPGEDDVLEVVKKLLDAASTLLGAKLLKNLFDKLG